MINHSDVFGYWMQAVLQIFSTLDANTIVFAFKTSSNRSCKFSQSHSTSILAVLEFAVLNYPWTEPVLSKHFTAALAKNFDIILGKNKTQFKNSYADDLVYYEPYKQWFLIYSGSYLYK